MKRFLSVATLILISTNNYAANVSLVPSTTQVNVGDNFFIDIVISQLADDALGGWDGNFIFNSNEVSLISTTLGDSVLGNQLDLSGLGTLNETQIHTLNGNTQAVAMLEVSYDDMVTLNASQANVFSLAQLQFTRLGAGEIIFNFDGHFSDAAGIDLRIDHNGAVTQLAPVPLPAAAWLMFSGLATVLSIARKQCRT